MAKLYPLLMKPRFDPRPWGARDLSPIYPAPFAEKIGESWLTGNQCTVQNGPLAGRSLEELADEYRRQLVGEAPKEESRFPLLVKFLFPHEKLSLQVHPDDSDARSLGHPCGKTECWYVVDACPQAQIALGLKPGTTRAEFERSIGEHRAEELLNWIDLSAGDMIYVAGGTVHTLGPGSIIVETQQQSDTTFRLYDYGRPRQLHLRDGMRVIKEKVRSGKVRPQGATKLGSPGNQKYQLILTAYFGVEKLHLEAAEEFERNRGQKTSAEVLVAIEGSAELEAEGSGPLTLGKGDAVVVPATVARFRIHPQPGVEFLKSYVPGLAAPEPETFLE